MKNRRGCKEKLAKLKKPVFAVTILDDKAMKQFGDALVKLLRAKNERRG